MLHPKFERELGRERVALLPTEPRKPRRWLVLQAFVILAMALAAALIAMAISAKEADAGSEYDVVTRTFSNPAEIQIPESGPATPYPSRSS